MSSLRKFVLFGRKCRKIVSNPRKVLFLNETAVKLQQGGSKATLTSIELS